MVELRHVEQIADNGEVLGVAVVTHPPEELQESLGFLGIGVRIPLTPCIQMDV